MKTDYTADELLAIARRDKPNVRYARNRKGDAIAAYHGGCWQVVAIYGTTGRWYSMTTNIVVDGKPMFATSDWMVENA